MGELRPLLWKSEAEPTGTPGVPGGGLHFSFPAFRPRSLTVVWEVAFLQLPLDFSLPSVQGTPVTSAFPSEKLTLKCWGLPELSAQCRGQPWGGGAATQALLGWTDGRKDGRTCGP